MLTVIGDVHGKIDELLKIIEPPGFYYQLGDLGFNYDFLDKISPDKFKFHAGNHDHYDLLELNKYPHNLGDFGVKEHGHVEFFFVRGAYSIDKNFRIPNISWWPQEELNYTESQKCIELYDSNRPEVVVSHHCPEIILPEMFGYTNIIHTHTGKLLDKLLKIHRPLLWIFGHHHISSVRKIGRTEFRALAELETFHIC